MPKGWIEKIEKDNGHPDNDSITEVYGPWHIVTFGWESGGTGVNTTRLYKLADEALYISPSSLHPGMVYIRARDEFEVFKQLQPVLDSMEQE